MAGAIPVNQWGPNTVNALKSRFPGIDTSQTLRHGSIGGAKWRIRPPADPAQAASAADYRRRSARNTPGTTINSNPMASLGGKIGDLAGNLQKDLGKSDEAQKPPDIKPDIPPAPGARNVSPLLGGQPESARAFALRPADGRAQSADDMGRGPAGADVWGGLWSAKSTRLRDIAHVAIADAQRPDVDEPDGRRIAMADLSNVTFDPQNPNALFSPDQWLNQFSNFNSKAIPWPSSYVGWPTDAMGNPIGGGPVRQRRAAAAAPAAAGSSTPGTTINSTPAAAGQADYSKLGQ